MSIYITIDGGTTNTRINLIKNKTLLDCVKLHIGTKSNNDEYKLKIKTAIEEVLKGNNLHEKDVVRIIASGMITSEFGLCNLRHIETPAGICELHSSMEEMELKEISSIPFVFIRGVKTTTDGFENTDIMRGEETELMGIVNPDYGKCIYVLPGSHSKIIYVDENGRITKFSTMLTGEMIASLSQHTILKDAVDLEHAQINREYLLMGYYNCIQEGINKALFKVRILRNVFDCDKSRTYCFFIGAVLSGEIEQIIKSDVQTVVIGGKAQIKDAMAEILENASNKKIIVLSEETVNFSTSAGAIRIFENDFK